MGPLEKKQTQILDSCSITESRKNVVCFQLNKVNAERALFPKQESNFNTDYNCGLLGTRAGGERRKKSWYKPEVKRDSGLIPKYIEERGLAICLDMRC